MADNFAATPGSGATFGMDEVVNGTLGTVKVGFGKIMDGTLDSTNKLIVTSAGAAKVDGSAVTQPVSAASLPLPSGAATAAKQPALGTAGTPSADVITVQGVTSMTPLKTDGSGATQPVSGTVTANAGTNLNTSALALETGGNLATIATNSANAQATVSTSGTLQNAVSATGNGSALAVTGYASAIFEVTGTFTATITFQGSRDGGTTYYAINTLQLGTSTIGSTTTSTGLFETSVAGLTHIRATVTWTSGTSVTVKATAVPLTYGAKTVQANLLAGSNLVGKVGIDQTTPGTTNGVQVNAALPAGTNVIGHVISDSGSVTNATLQTGTNNVGNVGTVAATVNVGQNAMTAGARLQLNGGSSIASTNGILIQALAGNAANVYVGDSGVTTGTGYELQPGQAMPLTASNINAVYIIGTGTDGVCWNVL